MFKLKEIIRLRKQEATAAAILLLTALLFYAGARMLPAIADETSWADTKFGPLNGLEESVYSQTAAAYQDSFLSVARKQQPILSYTTEDASSYSFRTLPVSPGDFAGDAALEVTEHTASQDIISDSSSNENPVYMRAGTAGVRPVSADIDTGGGIKQRYTFPQDVYFEVKGQYNIYDSRHLLTYTYMSDQKEPQKKTITIMNNVVGKFQDSEGNTGRVYAGHPLDCAASDLDGDGYSELIVTYLTKADDDAEEKPSKLYVYAEVYDGKKLFDAVNGGTVSYALRLNLRELDLSENKYIYSPMQVHITKGDFDGDGVTEFPVAFTDTQHFCLTVIKAKNYGTTSQSLEAVTGVQELFNLYNDPGRFTTQGMDVTVGDFDGNGADEIMVVYGEYNGKMDKSPSDKNRNRINITCYKADINDGSLSEYFLFSDNSVNLWCGEDRTAQIYAEAADFDGDGKDELVYTHPGWVKDNDERGSYVSVRKWTTLDDEGELVCNQSTYEMFGWHFDDSASDGYDDSTSGAHAMTVGNFKCTNDNANKQIAIANVGTDNKIDYAVIEAVKDTDSGEWSFKTHTSIYVNDALHGMSKYPQICLTAVDYDHQTMLLGEPTVYTLNAKIQPIFELQMAARHYDVVDGASIDAFSKQVGMPMYGVYKTQADCTENDEVSSTETGASETTLGVSIKASGNSGTSGCKKSVNASAGYSYTNTQKESNTQSNKYSATSSVNAAGTYDDFVYYQLKEVEIYRYPVLYPLDYARGYTYKTSDDTFGTSGDMEVSPTDMYLEIQVPQEPEMVAVSGLNAEWYDPVHQPYNLFTYPRDISEIKNYSSSVGKTTRTKYTVGEEGNSSVSVKLTEITGDTDTSSTTNKNSFNAELGGGFGTAGASGKNPVSVSASFNYDKTNSDSSTSSSNLTKTSAFTMTWPGLLGYSGVYTGDELTNASFGAALAMMIENTGNFVMAQMVTDIKKSTPSSSLWYSGGSYSKHPDPALNLPHRLNHDTREFKEATADDDTPRIMRGVTIYNGLESAGDTLSTNSTSYRALMADKNYTVKVRVYNCSYVDTKDVKAELYWTNEWKADSELTESDKVGESILYAINGWSSTGDSNIKEFAIEWKASDKLSETKAAADGMLTGYLHVKLVPNGEEIHSDNNWGYVRMALLNPDTYQETATSSASSAKLTASRSASAASQPPVTAEFVKKSAEIITENGRRYIQAKVHLTSQISLPDVKLLVISTQKNGQKLIVAGRALGGIHTGEKNVVTVKAPFIESIAKNSTGVEIKVLSPWLKPEGKTADNNTEGSGGSGGCSSLPAGLSVLFVLALLPLAGKIRKNK